MSHEQSETIERDGLYYNVYGRNTKRAGQPLPPVFSFEKPHYSTLDEAVKAAQERSRRGGGPEHEQGGPKVAKAKLQRVRDRDTGAITGYVYRGTDYTTEQFRAKLRQLFDSGDPDARAAIEKFEDFADLRRELPKWKAGITAREAKAKGYGGAVPTDPELRDAELQDLDAKMGSPKTTAVDRVKMGRRRDQIVAAQNPRGAHAAVQSGRPSYGQTLADASERRKFRDARESYRGLILSLERALGHKPSTKEIDSFIRYLSQ